MPDAVGIRLRVFRSGSQGSNCRDTVARSDGGARRGRESARLDDPAARERDTHADGLADEAGVPRLGTAPQAGIRVPGKQESEKDASGERTGDGRTWRCR